MIIKWRVRVLFVCKEKLKALKEALKKWNKEEFGILNEKQARIEKEINALDVRIGVLARMISIVVCNFKKNFARLPCIMNPFLAKSLKLYG